MNIKSQITVGNNSELGIDWVEVETNCHGYITLKLNIAKDEQKKQIDLQLSRQELREFLARTCPEFSTVENYKAQP